MHQHYLYYPIVIGSVLTIALVAIGRRCKDSEHVNRRDPMLYYVVASQAATVVAMCAFMLWLALPMVATQP